MIVKTTATIEGVDDVIATLRALPSNVAGKLVKPAMAEAGDILRQQTRWEAYRQLQGAERAGYKRKKPGPHLYTTAAARVKTYRKGETTFVAVGFDYRKGGSHAHLVELGHRIVKGGTLAKGTSPGGITAAGLRMLFAHGWDKRKGRGRKRRGFANAFTGEIIGAGGKTKSVSTFRWGKRLRGGGRLIGGMTRPFPMLRPAFDKMKRSMLIAIELELRKIEAEATRLAKTK